LVVGTHIVIGLEITEGQIFPIDFAHIICFLFVFRFARRILRYVLRREDTKFTRAYRLLRPIKIIM
ncbi:MAG: hypothetical protein K2H68_03715, partial [Bacteroidales bacterium]|nr:hypothetical protein [Bacteroidales bacterium]